MRRLRRTSQFKKDVKRMAKRGKKFETFKKVIGTLLTGKKLGTKYKDHYWSGNIRAVENVTLNRIGYWFTNWQRMRLFLFAQGVIRICFGKPCGL